MENAKPKNGYARLKIKYEKLKKAHAESAEHFNNKCKECAEALRNQYLAQQKAEQLEKRRQWLYDNAPFWTRWAYERKFQGGGE